MSGRMEETGRRSPVRRVMRRVTVMALFQLPRPLLCIVLTVELAAVALIAVAVGTDRSTTWADVGWGAALAALGILHAELAHRIDYLEIRLGGAHNVVLNSTWIFAGALVLPPSVVWAVVVVLYAHGWFSIGRSNVIRLYRRVFTTASMVLASFAANVVSSAVDDATGAGPVGIAGMALALLAFTTVNAGLVAVAIALSTSSPSLSTLVGSWNDNLFEVCTLCLGGLVAAGFLMNPLLVLFVVPPMLVLHRSARAHQLAEAAALDGKTGLLNAAAWHTRAEAGLADRRAQPWGLLVLDLDHFKRVNDTYGHLVGDDVLAAVARAVSGEVRDRDLVGRFGGEEFVVLLSLPSQDGVVELRRVAERIRTAVAALTFEVATADGPLTVGGVTVSIGAALAGGRELHDLMQAADAALYAAKRGGRNQVRTAEDRAGDGAGRPVLVVEPGLSTA
jgi:diguanylate cyclase (GGDEF)-like protein